LIAARLGDQRTSAMAADIVEGAYPSVSAPSLKKPKETNSFRNEN
jgi:hypothetical protein